MKANRAAPAAPAIPAGKHIVCEGPRDFAAYYDGNIVGYRSTRIDAESLLDSYVYELLRRGNASIGAFAATA